MNHKCREFSISLCIALRSVVCGEFPDHPHFHTFLYLILYLRQFYALWVIPPKHGFILPLEIKNISFSLWSRHFSTTKLETLKTTNTFYSELKEFTNYKTNTDFNFKVCNKYRLFNTWSYHMKMNASRRSRDAFCSYTNDL